MLFLSVQMDSKICKGPFTQKTVLRLQMRDAGQENGGGGGFENSFFLKVDLFNLSAVA